MSSETADNEMLPAQPGEFQFTLVLSGGESFVNNALEDALFSAGCDDALLYSVDGQVRMDFDRVGDSLETAVRSAIHDVERCGKDVRVVEVAPPLMDEFEAINRSLRQRPI
jgi:hypothetical protein